MKTTGCDHQHGRCAGFLPCCIYRFQGVGSGEEPAGCDDGAFVSRAGAQGSSPGFFTYSRVWSRMKSLPAAITALSSAPG